MTIRSILIIGSSLGALASSAFAAVEPLNCKAPVNAAKEECFCQDSNIPNLSDAGKELCVAWIASGGVPAGSGDRAGCRCSGCCCGCRCRWVHDRYDRNNQHHWNQLNPVDNLRF
jgi:hypothetical protein